MEDEMLVPITRRSRGWPLGFALLCLAGWVTTVSAQPFLYVATPDAIEVFDTSNSNRSVAVVSANLGRTPSLAVDRTARIVYVATNNLYNYGAELLRVSVAQGTAVVLARSRNNNPRGEYTYPEVALHPDGNTIAVAELNSLEVTAFDVNGVERWSMSTTGTPFSRVAFSPDGSRLFAVGGVPPDSATFGLFIRTLANSSVQVVRLGDQPWLGMSMLVAPAGDKVYLLSLRSLHVVDIVTGTVASHSLIQAGQDPMLGAAISRDGRSIYVVTRAPLYAPDFRYNLLRVLNTATNAFTGSTLGIDAGGGYFGFAVSPNNQSLYVASDRISVINTVNLSVVAEIARATMTGGWSRVAFAALPAGCGTQDTDGDFVVDCVDNCPRTPNSSQEDSDGDGVGNVCDPCPTDAVQDVDGDGLCSTDNCPRQANSDQTDSDRDGMGDACDKDDDNDGILDDGGGNGVVGDQPCRRGQTQNCDDNCRTTPNPNQADRELDASGNRVGDGVGDLCDNCPDVVNPDQRDADLDGQGDACDCDDDNDGFQDPEPGCKGPYDNCQWVFNPDQEDLDQDGLGWACDPRERARFKTGKLYFDAQLEVLAEVLEKNGFQWPWGPGDPPRCPYCKAAAPTEYAQWLVLAERYVKAHRKGKPFTREDVYAFLTMRDDLPLSKEIIRKLIDSRAPRKQTGNPR